MEIPNVPEVEDIITDFIFQKQFDRAYSSSGGGQQISKKVTRFDL